MNGRAFPRRCWKPPGRVILVTTSRERLDENSRVTGLRASPGRRSWVTGQAGVWEAILNHLPEPRFAPCSPSAERKDWETRQESAAADYLELPLVLEASGPVASDCGWRLES